MKKTKITTKPSPSERTLLLKIAETVGELFEDIKPLAAGAKREVIFDQAVCAELWNDYQDWLEFSQSKTKRPDKRKR